MGDTQRSGRKHVVLTHEFFPYRGGIATWVEELATAAVGLGFDIEVWCPASPELASRTFAFPVRQLPVPGGQKLRSQLALARYLRAHRADWEHAEILLPEPGPIRTFMAARWFGIPVPARFRVVLHGTEAVKLAGSRITRGALSALLAKAERIVCVSQFTRAQLLARLPALAATTTVSHAAPRTDLEVPPASARLPHDPRELVLLTVGRIGPRKGQLAVIEAIGKLPAELRARVVYRIAGQTNNTVYRTWLRATAAMKGVRLELLGKVPDAALRDEYARADVFAMTSKEFRGSVEGFGLVYLEAGLFRLPVLAHDTGGVSDAVVDGKTGFLVQPDDRDGLAAAIRRFAEDPALRTTMGQANFDWAASFSWARLAEGVLG